MSTQAMYVEDEINEQSQQLAQLSLGEERRERDGMFVVFDRLPLSTQTH
jgi:hypothetical protein